MNRVKITAIRQTVYTDLMAKYENPIDHACEVTECVSLWNLWPEAKETSTTAG